MKKEKLDMAQYFEKVGIYREEDDIIPKAVVNNFQDSLA
jgi:hypothetical protein